MATPVILKGKTNWVEYYNYIQKAAEDKDVRNYLFGDEEIPAKEPKISDERYLVETYINGTNNNINGEGDEPASPEGETTTTDNSDRKRWTGNNKLRNLGLHIPSNAERGAKEDANETAPPPRSANETLNYKHYLDRLDRRTAVLFQQEYEKWVQGRKKVKTAKRLLYDSVSPSIQALIRKHRDPKEIWKYLTDHYEVGKQNARKQLLTALKGITLASCNYDAKLLIRKIFQIRDGLATYKMEMDNEEICIHILAALPPSYDSFKQNYEFLLKCKGFDDEYDLSILVDELTKEANLRTKKFKEKKKNSDKKSQGQQKACGK